MRIGRCASLTILLAVAGVGLAACDTVSRGTDMVGGLIGKPRHASAEPTDAAALRRLPMTRVDGPETLIGMSDGEIQAALGAPTFVRHEAPAAVWQYRRSHCIVDLFMYSDGPSSRYQVELVELRPLDAGGALSMAQRQACVDELSVAG